jgi:hypothetical protein
MFTLLIVLSLTTSKISKKYKFKSKNIQIHDVDIQSCNAGPYVNAVTCQTDFNDVVSNIGGVDADLLGSLETFVTNCQKTVCELATCKGIFNVLITEATVAGKLADFANLCDPSKSQADDQISSQPNDATSDEEDAISTTVQAPGSQSPGEGHQRWNTKEIGLLMILTNLIGLLYLLS